MIFYPGYPDFFSILRIHRIHITAQVLKKHGIAITTFRQVYRAHRQGTAHAIARQVGPVSTTAFCIQGIDGSSLVANKQATGDHCRLCPGLIFPWQSKHPLQAQAVNIVGTHTGIQRSACIPMITAPAIPGGRKCRVSHHRIICTEISRHCQIQFRHGATSNIF